MSARKRAYHLTALEISSLLARTPRDSTRIDRETQAELERIRDAMAAAGAIPDPEPGPKKKP